MSTIGAADRGRWNACPREVVEDRQREVEIDRRGQRDLTAVSIARAEVRVEGAQLRDCATMKRALPGGFELDDDPARIDVDAVHRYLSDESYWAAGRCRATVERLVRQASRVVGLYHGGEQVGFARAVSDGVAIAYLADVYVLREHQRHGLGKELVREMVERGPYAHVRWLLHTRDAHGLYTHAGFGAPDERLMERPARMGAQPAS